MTTRLIIMLCFLGCGHGWASGVGFRLSESHINFKPNGSSQSFSETKDHFAHVFVGEKYEIPETNLMLSFVVDYAQRGMDEIFGKDKNRDDLIKIKHYVSLDLLPTFKISDSTRVFALLGYGYNNAAVDALSASQVVSSSYQSTIKSMRMGLGFEALISNNLSVIGRYVDAQYKHSSLRDQASNRFLTGESKDISLGVMVYM